MGDGISVRSRFNSIARSLVLVTLLFGVGASHRSAAAPAPAGGDLNWWVHLRTTGYAFQAADTDNAYGETDRFGAYQHVDGVVSGLAGGRVTLRASGRLADDFQLGDRVTDRARLYTGYMDARLSEKAKVRLGRQFVHQEATSLTLDGLLVTFSKKSCMEVSVWGGVRAPLLTSYRDRTGDFGEDPAAGIRLQSRYFRNYRFSLSHAYRERDDKVSSRPLGFGMWMNPIENVRATARIAYDLEQEFWMRAEFGVRWRPARTGPAVALQFVDRSNRADAASWFSRFNRVERARIGRLTTRYEMENRFGGELEYSGAWVDSRTSTRLGGALLVPDGRLGYSARLGDSGEESTFYGDYSRRLMPWLRLGAGASVSTYALFKDAPEEEERDLTTAWGRMVLTPRPGIGLTVEGQRVENPAFSEDVRLLVGLDLSAGGGNLPAGWTGRGVRR